jgi:hypothetical protein
MKVKLFITNHTGTTEVSARTMQEAREVRKEYLRFFGTTRVEVWVDGNEFKGLRFLRK